MVGRAGLEPTCFRVSGLQPPAVAAVPPADIWSGWRDSNSRHPVPKTGALRKLSYAPMIMVDLVGLEPTLPCLQGRCFPSKLQAHMVLQTGLEPVLYGLSFRLLYRDWNTGAYGAVNGSRTRDLRLGKPMFCQLNYYCMVHDAGLEPAPFCL